MATIAPKWFCNAANSAQKRFHPRTLTGASDLQHGKNEITLCKSSVSFTRDALLSSNIYSSTSSDSRRNGRLCQHEVKRSFSSTPKPFSRKKPVKTTGDAETDKQGEFVPTLSFNYRATLAILEIARAVSPVISMNEGYTLTSNFDLRIDAFNLALEKTPVQLELNTYGKGSYLFTIDRASSRLNLVSPMSGAHTYAYDEEEQLWLSANSDRHDMRGMVTRDLLRHARGLAAF